MLVFGVQFTVKSFWRPNAFTVKSWCQFLCKNVGPARISQLTFGHTLLLILTQAWYSHLVSCFLQQLSHFKAERVKFQEITKWWNKPYLVIWCFLVSVYMELCGNKYYCQDRWKVKMEEYDELIYLATSNETFLQSVIFCSILRTPGLCVTFGKQ